MKLLYSWLCDYVNLDGLTPEEVSEKLTMGAFEVEEIEKVGPDLVGPVVAGEIVDIQTHPNADKIRLTKVKVGKEEAPLEIVCGAQNIEVGQRIPVALPGAIVLNRKTGEKLEIKASAIRGVHSNGMLCSPSELGITDGDTEGILILARPGESGIDLGTDIIEHMSLKPDHILHVAPRSNRGDALSIIGLAREVAALTGRSLKMPEWNLNLNGNDVVHQDKDGEKHGFHTLIENLEDCPYFSIRLIENIEIGPSPSWLARRLESIGLRTVNNVVDITNYVMLEFGQPLHAYDQAHVKGKTIAVRRARAKEQLTSIDAKVRELTDEVLAIADGEGVVGLAGIMGGKDSEISDTTIDIALEAAAFNPQRVRRGSRLMGLSSDSSLRFERGVDVESVKRASDRASYLIAKHCGPNVKVLGFFQSGSADSKPLYVSMRMSQVKRLLDVDMKTEEASRFLISLGFKTHKMDEQSIEVEVPSFRRSDVTREIDLIEEVCRLFGYDNLPEAMPQAATCPQRPDRLIEDVRMSLSGQGLSEAWLSSLRAESELESVDQRSVLKVLNPLSKDHQALRQSLLPGLADAVKHNQDRGEKNTWLFEIGRSYERIAESDKDIWSTSVKERRLVSGIITGTQAVTVMKSERVKDKIVGRPTMDETVDFYRIRGIVENLLSAAGVPLGRLRFYCPQNVPEVFHPFRACQVAVAPADKFPVDIAGKHEDRVVKLGFIGELHPAYRAEKDLREAAYGFELDLEQITSVRVERTFKEPASTPAVTRDLTADLEETIEQAAVASTIELSAGNLLVDLELVSIYPIEEGARSLSYRLTFQDAAKTLTGEELDAVMKKVRQSLIDRLKAKFRV